MAASPAEIRRSIRRSRRIRTELERRRIAEDGDFLLFLDRSGTTLEPFHRELAAHQDTATETLSLAPRGGGKTFVGTIRRVCFEIARNRNIRILIGSRTSTQAERFLRGIKEELEGNRWLIETFGAFAPPGRNPKGWGGTEVTVTGRTQRHKEATVTTVGIGGPVASGHYDLIILDDLTERKNVRTEAARREVVEWFDNVLFPAVDGATSRIMILGTPYHPRDILYTLEARGFATRKWPALIDEGKPEERSFWPDRFPVEFLHDTRRKIGSSAFGSQYQMRTDLLEGDIFSRLWLLEYEEMPDPDRMVVFVGCDPAATSADVAGGRVSKVDSDYWATVVGARVLDDDGQLGAELYLLEAHRERVTKDTYLASMVRLRKKYPQIRRFGVEVVAAQEWLAQDMAKKGLPIKRIRRTTDKVSRAFRLQPYLENGQIFEPTPDLRRRIGGPDNWGALEDELVLFPNAEHDDLFDALETCVDVAFRGGVQVVTL